MAITYRNAFKIVVTWTFSQPIEDVTSQHWWTAADGGLLGLLIVLQWILLSVWNITSCPPRTVLSPNMVPKKCECVRVLINRSLNDCGIDDPPRPSACRRLPRRHCLFAH